MIVQAAVLKETRRITAGAFICFALLLIAYLALGRLTTPVVLGALLGGVCAVACFFIMGLSVQKILELDGTDEEKLKRGKLKMRGSYMLRLAIMACVFLISAKLDCFDWLATAIMLVSPRLVVMLLPVVEKLFSKKATKDTEEVSKP